MQNRLRSWVLWVSVASLIIFILKTYIGIEIPKVDILINSILGVLVLFGVINNPTDATKI